MSAPTTQNPPASRDAEDPNERTGARAKSAIPTPAPLLREGELLGGRYRIERCLGGGGMAAVYRAIHTGLDQPVAVKIVSSFVRGLPGIVSRFMREARAATRLKGEHVVRVFDVGTAESGAPYLVMELLEGKDLGELFAEGGRPSVETAIDYTLQACEALAEVHGLGIVHRDLKPANLFVTRGPDGLTCLKLIDFGISRIDSPLLPGDAVALTSPDVVMGSPRYMPPEQMESAASADSRSDIWGLGAILYEMLTGHAPFDGESLWDIYAAAVRSPPAPPSSVNPDVPEELDEVVLRCLRVEPKERFADVAELAAALAPLGDENAAGRAEAITRVLETSRQRGGHDSDGAIPVAGARIASSYRLRKRASATRSERRRRIAGIGAAVLLLTGIGIAARPIARTMNFAPSVSVTGAAAATPLAEPVATPATTPAVAPSAAAPPAPRVTAGAEPADLAAVTGLTGATIAAPAATAERVVPPPPPTPAAPPPVPVPTPRKPAMTVDSAPRVAPVPISRISDAVEPAAGTSGPAPTADTPNDVAEPAPPPRPAPAPARTDDRILFEERK